MLHDKKDILVMPMLFHAFENFVLGPIFVLLACELGSNPKLTGSVRLYCLVFLRGLLHATSRLTFYTWKQVLYSLVEEISSVTFLYICLWRTWLPFLIVGFLLQWGWWTKVSRKGGDKISLGPLMGLLEAISLWKLCVSGWVALIWWFLSSINRWYELLRFMPVL